MNRKRVLVTGGAGFIGSNLANHLAEDNEVVVVDDGYRGTPKNLDREVEFQEKSVLDDDLPTDVDVVFHLAALSSYVMHEEDPTKGARVNVEGFVNTVEQARDDGCDTVVYPSTSSIYGNRTELSPEDMDVEVNTGYEASKFARERYAEYFANHYDMSMAGMRFFRSIRAMVTLRNTTASTRTSSPSSPTTSLTDARRRSTAMARKPVTSPTSMISFRDWNPRLSAS